MVPGEVLDHRITRDRIIQRYLALESDPRFRDFAGKIEINEYGDLIVNPRAVWASSCKSDWLASSRRIWAARQCRRCRSR
jgi:hypothetical protein